jgi:hypothetical protein
MIERPNIRRGLGLAGLSLVAMMMMSGASLAQDAGGEDGATLPDGIMYVIDPICEDCLAGDQGDPTVGDEIIYDEVVDDGSTGGDTGVDDGWVDDGSGGDDVVYDDGSTDGEIVVDENGDPVDVTILDEGDNVLNYDGIDNPEILYMSAGGSPLELGGQVQRSHQTSHRAAAAQHSHDLCATPAQELVWVCTMLNGKSQSE